MQKRDDHDFARTASNAAESSVVVELWALVREKKKYWLFPIIIALLSFGLLVFLSGTAAAPLIYRLF